MLPIINHPWDVSVPEAQTIQKTLSEKLDLKNAIDIRKIKIIAGTDVSYSKETNRCYAAIVLYDIKKKQAIENVSAIMDAVFPYVPGYLTFREGPSLIEAFKKINSEFDAIMCDGQGIAHPRGFGIAAHIGVIYNMPSIGCAKSNLVGQYEEPENKRFAFSDLIYNDNIIGAVVRTKEKVKPVFVSQGNKISLKNAVKIVELSIGKYRLPEPTRLAHILSNKIRTEEGNFIKASEKSSCC